MIKPLLILLLISAQAPACLFAQEAAASPAQKSPASKKPAAGVEQKASSPAAGKQDKSALQKAMGSDAANGPIKT
jgi:hypothetical protein